MKSCAARVSALIVCQAMHSFVSLHVVVPFSSIPRHRRHDCPKISLVVNEIVAVVNAFVWYFLEYCITLEKNVNGGSD